MWCSCVYWSIWRLLGSVSRAAALRLSKAQMKVSRALALFFSSLPTLSHHLSASLSLCPPSSVSLPSPINPSGLLCSGDSDRSIRGTEGFYQLAAEQHCCAGEFGSLRKMSAERGVMMGQEEKLEGGGRVKKRRKGRDIRGDNKKKIQSRGSV